MNSELVSGTIEEKLLKYEQLLNSNPEKRYHLVGLDDWLMELRDVTNLKTGQLNKKVFGPLTPEQALAWFIRHVRVIIIE